MQRSCSSGSRSSSLRKSGRELGPPSTPHVLRPNRGVRRVSALLLLACFVLFLGVAQLWGLGPGVRRAVFARCPPLTHKSNLNNLAGSKDDGDDVGGEPGVGSVTGHIGLWEQLCAREARRVSTAKAAAAEEGTTDAGWLSYTGSDRSHILAGDDVHSGGGDGGGSAAVTAAAAAAGLASAALAAAGSYHPAEWPNVYGGRAEPHKRILNRCTGSLFAPPLAPGSPPGEGLVAVWLPTPFDLAFCDPTGRSVHLALRPAGHGQGAVGRSNVYQQQQRQRQQQHAVGEGQAVPVHGFEAQAERGVASLDGANAGAEAAGADGASTSVGGGGGGSWLRDLFPFKDAESLIFGDRRRRRSVEWVRGDSSGGGGSGGGSTGGGSGGGGSIRRGSSSSDSSGDIGGSTGTGSSTGIIQDSDNGSSGGGDAGDNGGHSHGGITAEAKGPSGPLVGGESSRAGNGTVKSRTAMPGGSGGGSGGSSDSVVAVSDNSTRASGGNNGGGTTTSSSSSSSSPSAGVAAAAAATGTSAEVMNSSSDSASGIDHGISSGTAAASTAAAAADVTVIATADTLAEAAEAAGAGSGTSGSAAGRALLGEGEHAHHTAIGRSGSQDASDGGGDSHEGSDDAGAASETITAGGDDASTSSSAGAPAAAIGGQTIDLATSRALVANGGSVRIAWYDHSMLLADGVVPYMSGAFPCPDELDAACATVGGPGNNPGDSLYGSDGDGGGAASAAGAGSGGVPVGGWLAALGRWWGSGRRRLGGGGGSDDINGRRHAGGYSEGLGVGEEQAEGGTGGRGVVGPAMGVSLAASAATAAPMLVMAAAGDRMALLVLQQGQDVLAAAATVLALVRSPGAFTRRLEAAVVAAYEALRTVPYAIGLSPNAPAEDKRLSRKLYDILSVNTGSGWSAPDLSPPDGMQGLWDSCFYALGMNLVNHTRAWEQLQGLLRCQQPDGFLPHLCGGGRASQLTQPPLVAWAVWDNYLFSGDRSRLEWAAPRIERLIRWLTAHRSRDGGLTFFYVHASESGMDNSPRFDRLGGWGLAGLASWLGEAARRWSGDPRVGSCGLCAPHAVSVDLTALVAREMALMAKISRELGRQESAELWLARSRDASAALTARTWNPGIRMYGDVQHSLYGSTIGAAATVAATATAGDVGGDGGGGVGDEGYDNGHDAANDEATFRGGSSRSETGSEGGGTGAGGGGSAGKGAWFTSWIRRDGGGGRQGTSGRGAAYGGSSGAAVRGTGDGEAIDAGSLRQRGSRRRRRQHRRAGSGAGAGGGGGVSSVGGIGVVSDLATAAGLLPLLAGPLPEEQLRGLLEHIRDPDSFATPVPLPSVAVTHQQRQKATGPPRHHRDLTPLTALGPGMANISSFSSSRRQLRSSSFPQSFGGGGARSIAASAATPYLPYLDTWRGPMWANINYLVAVGLREQQRYLQQRRKGTTQQQQQYGGLGGRQERTGDDEGFGSGERRVWGSARSQEGEGWRLGEEDVAELCRQTAEWIERSTVAEVRRWYGGTCAEGDTITIATTTTVGGCTGTVFEFYDSWGEVPPSRLSRRGAGGVGGVRDHPRTAALMLRLMAERAARDSAMAVRRAAGGGGGGGEALLPPWVPGRVL